MSSSNSISRPGGDARALQERLHELISRVSDSMEIIKSWPESSGDDASIHVKTTTKLINSIRDILQAINRVEGVVKVEDSALWKSLKECPIPLDLLEMLDCSNGLNPEVFIRGLLREALSQLAGLRRRKVALEMLGNAIQTGLETNKTDSPESPKKRERQLSDSLSNLGPPTKKQNIG